MVWLPFEVVLPHKDIGHPSPSWRRPGQPTNTHISWWWWWWWWQWWWSWWLWWWWCWCQHCVIMMLARHTDYDLQMCHNLIWIWLVQTPLLVIRMVLMFNMMIMMIMVMMRMIVKSMMMTLIDLALVPPFCQVTVCQKKTLSFLFLVLKVQSKKGWGLPGDCLSKNVYNFVQGF